MALALPTLYLPRIQLRVKEKKMQCPGCSSKEDMVRVLLKETVSQRIEETGGEDGFADNVDAWLRYTWYQFMDYPINSLCWVFLIGFAL